MGNPARKSAPWSRLVQDAAGAAVCEREPVTGVRDVGSVRDRLAGMHVATQQLDAAITQAQRVRRSLAWPPPAQWPVLGSTVEPRPGARGAGMDARESAAMSARCSTREGLLETLREVERLLLRPSPALAALRTAVAHWTDAVAIDEGVAEAIGAVDVDLEPGARLLLDRLSAMRVATRARANEQRRTKATRRLRPR